LSAPAIASEISVAVRGSIENSWLVHRFRELLGPQRPQRVNEFDEIARFSAREMVRDIEMRQSLVPGRHAEVLRVVRFTNTRRPLPFATICP